METEYIEESVRVRLILAGLSELEEHGIADFSLRRAAAKAQVSCAAPYRHFDSKEEFIKEIIKYVNSQWELLSRHLNRVFSSDPARLAVEISIANIKFWIANHNYRSVFTVALGSDLDFCLDRAVVDAVKAYADHKGLTEDERSIKEYTVRALIAGSVMLVGSGSGEQILSVARKKLELEFLGK